MGENKEAMTYEKKNEEMKAKYKDAIEAIVVANGVDSGVAFAMLKRICRGYNCKFINEEELRKDYAELFTLAGGNLAELEKEV